MEDIHPLIRELLGAKTEEELRSALPRVAAVAQEPDGEGRLESLLSVVLDSEARVALALAMWLTQAEAGAAAAAALIRHCSVRYLMADAPAAVDLSFLRPGEAALAVRRMNQWVATPAFVVGWALEALARWPDDEGVFAACDRVLYYMTCDFPGPTHKLMSGIRFDDRVGRVREMLVHYRDQLAEDEERMRSFPWLAEFSLSGPESEVLRIHRQRTNDEVIRHAEERSVFARFATRYKFKYSHRVFLPAGDGETSLEMATMAAEAPMPLSEWSDPLDGVRRRNELWGDGES